MKQAVVPLLLFIAFQATGQSYVEKQKVLETIVSESAAIHKEQSQKVREYAKKNNIPIVYTDEFRTTVLVDVNEFGMPIFVSTDNANAAITTGVTGLRTNGSVGLNLQGTGMRVGIWDGGSVGHIEFENRIISTEGSAADAHSNHVTGTILAAGFNPDAKGMAPKAKLISFDFNNDISEMASMAKPDQSTLLLSNHSYGFVNGWDCTVTPCQWRGNSTVSTQEDYRFGFYTNNTKNWDLIANNAPYYTIVKSAGNDRQSGFGANFPADCNGGTGYDCIEEQATAKNIITVGAVNKVLTYTDPTSVLMSTFSGWGPTDDGRIKPDIVGDGVNVYSTVLSNLYGTLSGTSMSAPNVTGSLVLLQELYQKLNGGNFMLSSTLKALSIHTARETGLNPGPDYSFGWGLLDVTAAANVLINKDNKNIYVQELDLKNGEVFTMPLTPKANEKITATLVWNDPAGTPVAASLDPVNPMLVNDLDMRIVDDQANTQFPWALDPATSALGQAAFKADNFRDNVEKIEFDNPEERIYTLNISSKRPLAATQKFSLIITYSSVEGTFQKLYWINNSGDWNDPSHWSTSSGGPSAGLTPTDQHIVVFDENSFSSNGTVSLSNAGVCRSLLLLPGAETVAFSLNSNSLSLSGDLIASDSTFSIGSAGDIIFTGTSTFNVNKSDLSLGNFFFDGTAYKLTGRGKLGPLYLKKGSLDLSNTNLQIRSINSITTGAKTLNIKNAVVSEIETSGLNVADNLTLLSDSVIFNTRQNSTSQFDWYGLYVKGTINARPGTMTLNGNSRILRIQADGTLNMNGNMQFDAVSLSGGMTLNLSDNSSQVFSRKSYFKSTAGSRIKLQTTGNAKLNFDGNYKLCFDYLDITGVDITGTASVNAGLTSTVVNAANWMQEDCQNVILADFDVIFPCIAAQTRLVDKSQGLILNYLWQFSDPAVVATGTTTPNATATFPTLATYQVKLTVSNAKYSKSLQRDVVIGTNDLNENTIVLNNANLFSKEFASFYQWYKNNIAIPGATSRSYPFNGKEGAYTVLTSSATCSKISPVMVITGLLDEPVDGKIILYPNPAKDVLNMDGVIASGAQIDFFSTLGQFVKSVSWREGQKTIEISDLSSGIYIVSVKMENKVYRQKLIINK